MDKLRYPIGQFNMSEDINLEQIGNLISQIEAVPRLLADSVKDLTEDTPTIKPFNEALWAELKDARTLPVDVSLKLIETLHKRWAVLLRSLSTTELNRQFRHPEAGDLSLKKAIGLYAWHGNHHLAHITNYRKGRC